MLYYFDETADQGYVDKTSSLEEYGIIAGWSFPERKKVMFETKIDEVLCSLRALGYKKLHCTEVFKDDNNAAVQEQLYDILLSLEEYVIVHEGAYPLGVRQFEDFVSDSAARHAPAVPEHIKLIKNRQRTRLYITLLTGIIVKLEECATLEGELEVHMISDRIEKAIQDESAQLLSELSSSKKTVVAKAFDTVAKQRIDRSFEIEATSKVKIKIERVRSISYVENVTPLTFVADFICFEMLRHFRRRMKVEKPIKFHSPDVLEGFRLKNKIAFLGKAYFTDLVFKPTVGG